MNVSVFGLGYVGCVTAACFANRGHKVCGVDINQEKVDMIGGGRSPIVEPGLDERMRDAISSGRLSATTSAIDALSGSDICFVAVATPSKSSGEIDPAHLLRACEQIGDALATLDKSQVVVIRSSVLPSVFRNCQHALQVRCGSRAVTCVNPEFLREGTAIKDFENPPYTVLGTDEKAAENLLRSLYSDMDAPIYSMTPEEAVLVKYASNAFHAVKVVFGNEIGRFCKGHGIDGRKVMEVFVMDKSLNISPKYLLPGFAFGGSCLPKDVRALAHAGRALDMNLPLLDSLLPSNRFLIEAITARILAMGRDKVGLIGLSFKANTDDLRESPFVELAERLLGKGIDLRIFDPNVTLARLFGANKLYIEHSIPHVSRLLVPDLSVLAAHADVIVIGHPFDGVAKLPALIKSDARVIDFCKIEQLQSLGGRYDGIAW